MLTGHLAASILLAHYFNLESKTVIVGGISPDVIDKTLCHGLNLTPTGRMVSHTLLGLGISTVLIGLSQGRHIAFSWAVGYLGHLVCDSDGFVPWLYPFVAYQFKNSRNKFSEIFWKLLTHPSKMELFLLVWAIFILLKRGTWKVECGT